MRGIGQWASGPESWGPNWDLPHKKKKKSERDFWGGAHLQGRPCAEKVSAKSKVLEKNTFCYLWSVWNLFALQLRRIISDNINRGRQSPVFFREIGYLSFSRNSPKISHDSVECVFFVFLSPPQHPQPPPPPIVHPKYNLSIDSRLKKKI